MSPQDLKMSPLDKQIANDGDYGQAETLMAAKRKAQNVNIFNTPPPRAASLENYSRSNTMMTGSKKVPAKELVRKNIFDPTLDGAKECVRKNIFDSTLEGKNLFTTADTFSTPFKEV